MTLYQKIHYIDGISSNEIPDSSSGGESLGSSLLITPRVFRYNTYQGHGDYDLLSEGLVSLVAHDPSSPWGFYADGGFRIVTKADGTIGALEFARAMSNLCVYGSFDEAYSFAQLETNAKHRFLEMRCDKTSDFVKYMAGKVGLECRIVRMLTADAPNNFDDGHVAVEIHNGSKWIMCDISNDLVWKDGAGNYLSQKEIFDIGAANCDPELLGVRRIGTKSPGWMSAFYAQTLLTQDDLINWCGRIYQIPGIDHSNGKTYWYTPSGTESRSSWVESLNSNWDVISESSWDSLFY